MKTVNIHEAKTHLSRLVDRAVRGEPFVIAKAGRPMVKVEALVKPVHSPARRIGFMKGKMVVPDDIKTPFNEEMDQLFYGDNTK